MGPRTQELEAAFAAEVGAEHAVAVSSGSAALHLACLAAGVGPGDEVIVPAMTLRRRPRTPRATAAARRCSPSRSARSTPTSTRPTSRSGSRAHTKAIIAVHFCGYPADVEPLRALCEEHGLALIEDCAQADGGRAAGRRARSGRSATWAASRFFSKTQLGVGEGGIVVTDDEDLAGARALAALARDDLGDVGPPPRPRRDLRRHRRRLQLPHRRDPRRAGAVAPASAWVERRGPARGRARLPRGARRHRRARDPLRRGGVERRAATSPSRCSSRTSRRATAVATRSSPSAACRRPSTRR